MRCMVLSPQTPAQQRGGRTEPGRGAKRRRAKRTAPSSTRHPPNIDRLLRSTAKPTRQRAKRCIRQDGANDQERGKQLSRRPPRQRATSYARQRYMAPSCMRASCRRPRYAAAPSAAFPRLQQRQTASAHVSLPRQPFTRRRRGSTAKRYVYAQVMPISLTLAVAAAHQLSMPPHNLHVHYKAT